MIVVCGVVMCGGSWSEYDCECVWCCVVGNGVEVIEVCGDVWWEMELE
jgi:hypothetical protein